MKNIHRVFMKVNLYFGVLVDVIEFEPFLGNDIEKYKDEFEKWYAEKYCEKKEIFNYEPIYTLRKDISNIILNADIIIEWINEVYPESKVKVIDRDLELGEEDANLPYIAF